MLGDLRVQEFARILLAALEGHAGPLAIGMVLVDLEPRCQRGIDRRGGGDASSRFSNFWIVRVLQYTLWPFSRWQASRWTGG